ncbi:hypothetical protein [Amycolatopsis kentuckyensis]|uniref:hypothetical protein n=1 Tax=Amycolatopsis kentuckyensis TaxID=218823 RepID=UPI00356B4128
MQIRSKTRQGEAASLLINLSQLKWISVAPEDPANWDDTNRPVVKIDWVDLNEW